MPANTLSAVTDTLKVTVNSCVSDNTTITNKAFIGVGSAAGVASDTAAVTTGIPDTDLSITKSDSPDPVPTGNKLTYSIPVTNDGPCNTTGVTMTDTLPSDVTFVSATLDQGTCSESSGTVTCNLGNLSSEDNATVTIVVTPNSTGDLTNTASVTSTVSDPLARNNSASQGTALTTPAEADLSVTKSGTPDPVFVGNPLIYTVIVANSGPKQATGVVLTDILPTNVIFGSALPSQGSCSEASATVTSNL